MTYTKLSVLLALYIFTSCASDEAVMELSASSSPEIATAGEKEVPPSDALLAEIQMTGTSERVDPSCADIPSCSVDEQKRPYLCIAYRYGGQLLWEGQRLYGWGSNLCEAKRSLATTACEQGKDFSQLADLSCSPDPSYGKCPITRPKCTSENKPTKCMAKKYRDNDLTWEQRPTAWGQNECETRYLVQVRACEQGLEPQDLQRVTCENDPLPGNCPPAAPSCDLDQREPTECVLNSVGDIVFKKPWRTIGTSACEARYQLQSLLCRFSDSKHLISNSEMPQVECRAIAPGNHSGIR